MKNTTPILVLTGLAIVAALGIAGLTREQWMGQPTPAVATPETAPPAATAETAPAVTAPAETAPVPAAEKPAATAETAPAEQPAASAPAEGQQTEQTAAAQPEQTPPAAQAQPEPAAQPAAEPAQNAAPPAEVPAFDTVRVEKSGEAVIAGRAEAGSEVVVKLDGEAIGQATANEDGSFVVVPETPLPAGSGALTIEAKGKGDLDPIASEQSVAVIVPPGQQQEALVAVVSPDAPTKVLQKPEAPAPVETAAAEPPAAEQPAVEQPAAEQKPAKLVSIDAVDYDASGNIVFSGQGEKGNIARIYVDNTFVGDAAVGEDGRWSFSGTADVAQGVHTLRVDGLDAKGNVLNRVEVPFFREDQTKVAEAAPPAATPAADATADAGAATETPEPPAAATTPETASAAAQPEPEQQEAAQKAEETAAAATAVPEAETAAAAPAKPREGRIVIQPGNNLWRISRVLYGSGEKFTMLYEANKDQIRDPDLIYPGQVFKTPDVAPKAETVDPKRRNPLTPEENAAAE